ncbi:DUF4224 domain-containing protein [Metapseudomonas otitidis]|uniref:DUF4224 domain-containing protein n=1 Tax=Metapseudomonas otitidis TaxID=319939 RepID=UPI001CA3CA1C|nr:DUF4224 domain-containing protein [Pseudomonas otitidis]QZX85308.1 DUF4224 domain-containing protein [Pseudomonas otitidis]
MESEILSDEELAEITGYKSRAWQRRWLDDHNWTYIESRGKRPLVGRQYARLKLGFNSAPMLIQPPQLPQTAWVPDFSRVN